MKILFFLWVALIGVQYLPFSAKTAFAQHKDQGSQSHKLDTLFRVSGLENILENVESVVAVSENINAQALLPGQGAFARRIMRQVYSSEKFYGALRQSFVEDYKPQYILSVVKWYRSPLGKKILGLESQVGTLDDLLAVERFSEKLLTSPPGKGRIKLIEQIERSAAVTEAGKALFMGYVSLMSPFNNNLDRSRLGKTLKVFRKRITNPMRKIVFRDLLYRYRSLKDKELGEYSRFLNSRGGSWFRQTALKGLKKGIKENLYQAELLQIKLIKEIDSGGPEFPLLKEVAPPGQRYLLMGKRDPFLPLVDEEGRVFVTQKGPVKSKSRPRLFGRELKNIPPIALPILAEIENRHPKLYRKLKYFERLFNNRKKLKELDDDDYAQVIRNYRYVLEQSADIKVDTSPLQIKYSSLRMTGIIQKKKESVAMFEVGRIGYGVRKGDSIGPLYGYVDEVQEDQVIVLEKFRDYLGKILTNKKVIEFYQSTSSEGNKNL